MAWMGGRVALEDLLPVLLRVRYPTSDEDACGCLQKKFMNGEERREMYDVHQFYM